jgi:hypothetical protein
MKHARRAASTRWGASAVVQGGPAQHGEDRDTDQSAHEAARPARRLRSRELRQGQEVSSREVGSKESGSAGAHGLKCRALPRSIRAAHTGLPRFRWLGREAAGWHGRCTGTQQMIRVMPVRLAPESTKRSDRATKAAGVLYACVAVVVVMLVFVGTIWTVYE